jgi:hypothetical protein
VTGKMPLPWESPHSAPDYRRQLKALHRSVMECLRREPAARPSAARLLRSWLHVFESASAPPSVANTIKSRESGGSQIVRGVVQADLARVVVSSPPLCQSISSSRVATTADTVDTVGPPRWCRVESRMTTAVDEPAAAGGAVAGDLDSSAAPSALFDSSICTSAARKAFLAGRYLEDARRCAGAAASENVVIQGLDSETQMEALWALIRENSE